MSVAFKILLTWVIVLSFVYSTLSLLRHTRFESGGFDLGIYDQAVWQYSRFLYPYSSIKERFILGDHLTLTLPLLAPLYWLWSDARMLLLFQAFWLSFSSLAIFKIARLRAFDTYTSLFVSIVYSLFYGIQTAVFFDFHPVIIGVGLLPWIAFFLESKKYRLLWIAVAALLGTQENMGIALAGLGCFYLSNPKTRYCAMAFIFLGVISTIIAVSVVTRLSPIGFEYMPKIPASIGDTVTLFFDHPDKRQSWFWSLAWFSFLPLLSPGALLAMVLDLSQYFITGPALSRMWGVYTHHRAILAPFLTLGMLEAVTFLKRRINPRFVAFTALFVAIFLQYAWHLPLNKLAKTAFWKEEQWMRDDRAIILTIGDKVSIATQQNLVPHLSHRNEIYLAWPRFHDTNGWWLEFPTSVEYLLVDLRPDQWLTQILETNEHVSEAVHTMEKNGSISLEKEVGLAKLYKVLR